MIAGIALSVLGHASHPDFAKVPVALINSATISIPFWIPMISTITRVGEARRKIRRSRLYGWHSVQCLKWERRIGG